MNKLLQIPNYYYPNIGGIEQVARDIADALKDTTVEQKIICFNETAADGGLACRRGQTVTEQVNGIGVTRCGCFTKVASQSLSLGYPAQLKKLLQEFGPDMVIFHYPNPFVASFLLPLLPKSTRLILWWHLDIIKQKHLKKLFHGQTMQLLERADRVVATSPNYIEGSPYLRQFRQKCRVVPNCIRPERLQMDAAAEEKARQIRQRYAGKTVCFAIGRHVPYKGIEYLIRAAEYLDDSFVILIGGEGPLTGQLKQLAAGDTRIEFLGRIPPDELAPYYSACDIFCFPSITKNEAFGIALAEGMYFSKPAVTFTIPGSGVNYVSLAGETGIEVPNRDAKAYAGAIRQLAGNAALRERYGEAARQRVTEHFVYFNFVPKVKEILEI